MVVGEGSICYKMFSKGIGVMVEESEAIVLRYYHLGERDKIVLFFTRDFGKIKGVVRDAFLINSRYGSSLEPFSYIRLRFSERRELARVEEVKLIKPSLKLEHNPLLLWLFSYIAELTDLFTVEHDENEPLFRLLLAVLQGVEGGIPPLVVARYFEFWLLKLTGFMPEIRRRCARCNLLLFDKKREVYFGREGLICKNCLSGEELSLPRLSRDGFLLLRLFFTKALSEFKELNIPGEKIAELRRITIYLIRMNLGKEPKSLSFLSELASPTLSGGGNR